MVTISYFLIIFADGKIDGISESLRKIIPFFYNNISDFLD